MMRRTVGFILSGLLLSSASVFASGNTVFTTLAQAVEHCPANSGLIFTPSTASPTSGGKISGTLNGVLFQTQQGVVRPYLGPSNVVLGALFYNNAGSYGYIVGNLTRCFYVYPNAANGGSVYPVLQGRTS